MKAFIVVSCLVLAVACNPQGYSYDKPGGGFGGGSGNGFGGGSGNGFGGGSGNGFRGDGFSNDGLSVQLWLPQSQNQQVPTSFPPLSAGHGSQSFSSGSLGLGSHSSGGSLSLGSSFSVGGHSGGDSSFGGHSGGGSSFGGHSGGGSSFGGHSGGGSSFGGSSFGGHSGGGSSFGGSSFGGSSFGGNSFSGGNGFTSGGSQGPAPAGPATTLVQKHIYVHVPPHDEEEEAQPHPVAPAAPAQKHYKIIFIKAPSGPSAAQQLPPPVPQAEEKTLVYVLVKKPESVADLANSIPRAPLTQPSKPEVYFIKYKAQTEAGGHGAGGHGVGGHAAGGHLAQESHGLSAPSGLGSNGLQSLVGASGSGAEAHSSQSFDTSSSLAGSVIEPRTPAAEYGPPKH